MLQAASALLACPSADRAYPLRNRRGLRKLERDAASKLSGIYFDFVNAPEVREPDHAVVAHQGALLTINFLHRRTDR